MAALIPKLSYIKPRIIEVMYTICSEYPFDSKIKKDADCLIEMMLEIEECIENRHWNKGANDRLHDLSSKFYRLNEKMMTLKDLQAIKKRYIIFINSYNNEVKKAAEYLILMVDTKIEYINAKYYSELDSMRSCVCASLRTLLYVLNSSNSPKPTADALQ